MSARPSGSKGSRSGDAAVTRAFVTNEAGDSIEVTDAHPSHAYAGFFNKDCTEVIPYYGPEYNPCGYVTFHDAGWESSKAPKTNVEEDAEYDACGNMVSSGKTEGWHVVGTEYTNSGWHAGEFEEVPPEEPATCLGTWTELYVFTETFSDHETLSDSIEVHFTVAPEIPDRATWGGSNPAELPCSQVCVGDPVNTATGDFSETTRDLSLPGRGLGLNMIRTYSSLGAKYRPWGRMGEGWWFSYEVKLFYDEEARQAIIVNGNGTWTVFDRNSKGQYVAPPRTLAELVEHEDGSYTYTVRKRLSYTFDPVGRLTSIEDLNGDKTTLSYDKASRVTSATDDAGRSLTFTYNAADLVESATDSTGRSVSYDYNEEGDLIEVTDVRGGHERFTYDKAGLLLTKEDARGNTVLTNTYNPFGSVATETNGDGNTTTFSYVNPFARTHRTFVEDPRGYETEFEYVDGILKKKVEAQFTFYKATWSYEHDPYTLGITAVTDPNEHTSRATYDRNGDRTSTEDALGNRTESFFDSLGDVIEYTDENGVTTTYEYDERGNLLSSSTPLAGSEPPQAHLTSYGYEDKEHPGDLTAITDPNENITQFAYDAGGNLESVTDAEGDETTFSYDERGNLMSRVSPRGNEEGAEAAKYRTAFTYDKAGNRLSSTDPLGAEHAWTYDADGNLESETDAKSQSTSYSYDAANRLIAVERPDGQTERTTYDEDGNVQSETDGLEHVTTYSYDPLDELIETTDPLGRSTEYRYDQAGNRTFMLDAAERATDYHYDQANELTEVEYEEEPAANVEYEYGPDGRRVATRDKTGETSYEYDSLGHLVAVENGHGDTTAYEYDLAGNEVAIVYPNGKTVSRSFDNVDRLTGITDWLGNTSEFEYDGDSSVTSVAFPEGTDNSDDYVYDRADQLSEVTMNAGAEQLSSIGYERDEAGLVEESMQSGLPGAESESFEYDEDSRLVQAGSEAFAYDAANNLTEAPGASNSYDAAGEIKGTASTAYHYNRLGQRTEAATPTASYAAAIGTAGSGSGEFGHPAGIAVDSKGNVWVADQGNDRLEEFDEEGEYLGQIGEEGSGEGQLEEPTDVAIDSNGNLWVTDSGNARIEKFTEAGVYLASFGSEGEEEGQFARPESLAIDSHDHIWIADTYNHRVQELSDEGEVIRCFGESGSEEGQISEATAIAVGPEDEIWLADYGNFRVDEFGPEGEFIRQVGSFGFGDGEFEGPSAIDADAAGNVWVVDEWNQRVEEFDREGKYLGQFGEGGSADGQFDFGWRDGLAVDAKGNIWIADTGNARVQKWRIPEASEARPTTYEYDRAGNLSAVDRPEAGEQPKIEESYSYDGTGLRVSQAVSGSTSYLTWDQSGSLPLLLSDEEASYIYGPSGLPIEEISNSGTPTYYHHDQLGSTRMLTDANGEVTAKFSYGAYGALGERTGAQGTPLGYAGQYTNVESGLQYLSARVYDPSTGQFLTRDPIVDLTREPYEYGRSDPVNHVDRTGLEAEELEIPCTWPCPTPAVTETIENAAHGIGRELNNLWDAITSDDDGEAVPAAGQCPLERPASPNFDDPSQPPGPGWEWRGNGAPGTGKGSWHNPDTDESLYPDLGHAEPLGPHYDYIDPNGAKYRVYPDGRIEPKK